MKLGPEQHHNKKHSIKGQKVTALFLSLTDMGLIVILIVNSDDPHQKDSVRYPLIWIATA